MPVEAPRFKKINPVKTSLEIRNGELKPFVGLKQSMMRARSVFGDSKIALGMSLFSCLDNTASLAINTVEEVSLVAERPMLTVVPRSIDSQAADATRKEAFRAKIARTASTGLLSSSEHKPWRKDSTGVDKVHRPRRPHRPRGVCPDCGAIYIRSEGHPRCSKKREVQSSQKRAA